MSPSHNLLNAPRRIAQHRSLFRDEIALLEVYQRQDAMSTQLWQHFMFVNLAVIGLILLITHNFSSTDKYHIASYHPTIVHTLGAVVGFIYIVYIIAGFSAIRTVQKLLAAISHQIQGDVGDKTDLFAQATRSMFSVALFYFSVTAGVFVFCAFLVFTSEMNAAKSAQAPAAAAEKAAAVAYPSLAR